MKLKMYMKLSSHHNLIEQMESVCITRSDMLVVLKSKAITAVSIPGKAEDASEKSMPMGPLKIELTETRKQNSRQVGFDQVQIRSYYITIGDNPSCKPGAPVSLDW
jgi:hypothetical protein